jgi:phospholipid/cholesterol/gamma-HCH transport system ATP-binding protein
MIKRVALARALAIDPPVIFLDEPTSGLDPIAAEEFDELILYLKNHLDLTVVMISHDLDSLFNTCDRIAVLVDKKIIVDTPARIVEAKHPWIARYFGGKRGITHRQRIREEIEE